MRRLIQLTITNPVIVVILVMLATWGGIFSLFHLPVGLFPGLDLPVVNVISHYPGTPAEDMELLVTRPIEDRIRTISGIRRVSSTSTEGISQITAEFNWGIRLTDARQLVQGELSSVQSDLPTGELNCALRTLGLPFRRLLAMWFMGEEVLLILGQ